MKYNMSKIMTEAHRLRLKYKLTLSEGLKMAWADVKSGVSYQDWANNKIDAMIFWNKRYAFKIAFDVSPAKYLKTRKAAQVPVDDTLSIDTLDFADM